MFRDWDNFFMLLGTAAGGLIGLVFIVVTLTAGFDRDRALRGSSRYMTPTVLQFSVVLLVSAIASSPLTGGQARIAIILVAAATFLHAARNAFRMFAPGGEALSHWSDPWHYGAAPAAAYVALAATAGAGWSLGVAVMAMVILFCGVRNAWDLITWIAPMRAGPASEGGTTPPPG